MNAMRAFFILVAVAVMMVVLFRATENEQEIEAGAPDAKKRQELVFKLQYIGRDYQYAVADGRIINEFEYAEMGAFCQRVIELYLEIQPNISQNETVLQLEELRQMVFAKVDPFAILDVTKSIIRVLIEELEMPAAPVQSPDLSRGKFLYRGGGCGVCHGSSGAGDGRAAAWLDPGPGSFSDPEAMHEATAYQFFNAIQLGVIGTGMPAYEEAYTEQEAWILAFYLMTLREDFDPRPPVQDLGLSLKDLATRSDADLLLEISERDQGKLPADASTQSGIDFLRSRPNTLQ